MGKVSLIAGFTGICVQPIAETIRSTRLIPKSKLAGTSFLRAQLPVLRPFPRKFERVERLDGIQSLARPLPHACVTIGNFDGVHLGHRQIFDLTMEKARARGGCSVAYTFRPHPQVALRPGSRLPLLNTYEEKAELIGQAGMDVLIEEPFSREFSSISPEHFFNEMLLHRMSAEEIVVGYDFAFCKGREGHLERLEVLCKRSGVVLTIVPPHKIDNEIVSSSRIRAHLLAGEIEAGNRLLGREFSYRGVVVRGEGRGRTLGFPTANLKLEDKLALPNGVYATRASVEGVDYPAVTNIGVRPTFQSEEEAARLLPALIEVHLLDQTIDLYGRTLEARFLRRLREERKFAGFEALKAQIALDAQSAREILAVPTRP